MSQFGFLQSEWPDIYEAAACAEAAALGDPRTCAFYTRRALEITLLWLYKYDARLKMPYQDNLSALIHDPGFANVAGSAIFAKARYIKTVGNKAAHEVKPIAASEARTALGEFFHVGFWLARTYAKGAKPDAAAKFDPARLPEPMAHIARLTLDQVRRLEAELKARDEKLAEAQASNAALNADLQRVQAELAAVRAANEAAADTHDYNEAETRDRFVDLLLREAGWDPEAPNVAEYEISGMPNATGKGYIDYVLWGNDSKPLAIVEAKATRHSPEKGRQQAKLYADCLERDTGQRPIIFTTNGYEHVLWDDSFYPPRPVQGFYKKDELTLLIQRRATRKRLADTDIDSNIAGKGRPYQQHAIRRITEGFEAFHARRALLVMATGAGKTRTVIALTDMLMRANWAKRILFLADRQALVKQAAREFVKQVPSVTTVNLLEDKEAEGRIYISTYPTMMKLIDEVAGGQRRFGPGHFDLLVIDEAHRSVYKKYGAIFEYFDSLLVGLTATPRQEIDRNTYRLFNLEDKVPTYAYQLEEAINDRVLVPMRAVSVPLRFLREGLRYDALSAEEKEAWDAAEWEEEPPDRVEAEAVNKWLFNADTVDKVLEHLMAHGQRVAGGDRIGKTIIFAKNQKHAEFIAERYDLAYPAEAGATARVIHSKTDYAQTLIDSFAKAESAPHIAISVDMLDTGIDVPEIVNLVFLKLVRSNTKFWQMIGRGTRLCPDLLGPGQDKQFFYVFDFCQNLEYFSQSPGADEGSNADSLAKRLFVSRLDLIGALDARTGVTEPETTLRAILAERLHAEVAAMTLANFLVRPHRKLVEHFATPQAWETLDETARIDLARNVAGLPSALPPEKEESKRFDLLMLRLQLGILVPAPGTDTMRDAVIAIASALEEQISIPAIRAQIELIQDIQTDAWWQDVTLTMLERARRDLRGLVPLIEKRRRAPIYTDFADTMGAASEIAFERFAPAGDFEKYRAKMRHFLRAHENHVAISKLRLNRPLTPTDVAELERMLIEEGGSTEADLALARTQCQSLGLFVRSLIGLDRAAAKEAFADLLAGKSWRPNQIAFLDMLINHLTEQGAVEADRLYAPPYTDMNPAGVEGLFTPAESDRIFTILDDVRGRAAA